MSTVKDEILEYIAGFSTITRNATITHDDKTVVFDAYISELRLAFEIISAKAHSELNGVGKDFHLKKTNQAKSVDRRLVHIWEHEWISAKPLLQSRIMSLLGVNRKIYARHCAVVTIDDKTLKTFLNNFHIQGYSPASVRYGLIYEGALVAVMTFGKSRFDKTIQYELLRYASMTGINVVGGASRLFARYVKDTNPLSVVSYSDRMRNSGNLYRKLGFSHTHTSSPSYYYTKDYVTFENRVAYQKHKLSYKLASFDANKSEWENMKLNGFDRIWDCGNDVWIWIQ